MSAGLLLPTLALLQKGGASSGPMERVSDPTIIGVALAYFAVIVAISVWATRRTRTASDFFVAGHGIGLAFNLSVLGFLELSLGHADRADAIFGPIVERARAIGFDEPGSAWWIGDAIEAAVITGAADRAE